MKVFYLILFVMITGIATSQTLDVKEGNKIIDGKKLEGADVWLNIPTDIIRDVLFDWMEERGDAKVYASYFEANQFEGLEDAELIVTATLEDLKEGSQVWMAFTHPNDEMVLPDINMLLEEFSHHAYRLHWQNKINEVEQVLTFFSKSYQKEMDNIDSGIKDSTKYFRELVELENKTKKYENLLEETRAQLEKNLHQRDSLSTEVNNMKSLLETYRLEQKKWKE